MPDPIEQLSDFEPGVPMSPMSPAEIRRRGERRRRRNAVLAVGGAAAAVLLVAVPLAVVDGDDDGGGTPEPAQQPISTDDLLDASELPARPDLTPYEETLPEGQLLACAPAPPASLDEARGFRRDFRADFAEGPTEGPPNSVIRTEVLQFDDAAEAREAYDRAQGWLFGCPGGDNLARKGVSVTEYELEDGVGEWRLHEFYAPDICEECDAIRFDRMGIAQFGDRMVAVSLAEVGGPLEPEGLDQSMHDLFFAAVEKAGGEITGAAGASDLPSGPDSLDFPIETGLPEIDGEEFRMDGPGPEVDGVLLPEGFCGAGAWPADGTTGRLAVQVSGPEYGMTRELVTFISADEASLTISALRDAVQACPVVPGDEPANDLTLRTVDVDSGYDDATFAVTYGEGLGGTVFQFVRVGHAVLATAHGGEYSPSTVAAGARELNRENQQLTPLMCEYTEEGC
jgi:hypothetical protein